MQVLVTPNECPDVRDGGEPLGCNCWRAVVVGFTVAQMSSWERHVYLVDVIYKCEGIRNFTF